MISCQLTIRDNCQSHLKKIITIKYCNLNDNLSCMVTLNYCSEIFCSLINKDDKAKSINIQLSLSLDSQLHPAIYWVK